MPLELRVLPGRLAVCRLSPRAAVPAWVPDTGPLVVIARTGDELSIVCDQHAVPDGTRAERGFRALVVRGPLAFDAVGILAGLTSALAGAAIPLLAVSTFDTDYVLIREERVGEAVNSLRADGYIVNG